ncbi:HAD family hydrolase [Megasphaera paucivorans]|uniref:D,D-heptose 1,7-bisphosphate phosphatase n=1 Tax=Megasphaera paucivorans TaxID=349095 RepID=A0A1G9XYZ5_9FIRM|nr:HAD family hydrolase [Megasphaera paucivorans]SDN02029.1 D-glycero-D-manno-heptose 1,7-bisphosphate phosphatase [Megasphaera paucivorans]
MRKAAFFDRDGVLNKDIHYLHRPGDVIWVKGAKEGLAHLNQLGYLVIVVTNQSGVARGYYTEDDVKKLHCWMSQEIAAAGGCITEFYYCPFLEGAADPSYNKKSDWRKPAPGMVLQAVKDYDLDISQSFLIGDSTSDMECAKAAGLPGYLFTGGRLDEFIDSVLEKRNAHESL